MELQIKRDRVEIEVARDEWVGENSLQLRREDDALTRLRVVERLLSCPVAGEQQALLAHVPQRDREHPAQQAQHSVAEILVQMRDDFRVDARPEGVTSPLQENS